MVKGIFFSRLKVVKMILESGVIPVFFNGSIDSAKKIVKACYDGGARVVEFTNRGQSAVAVFGQLVEWRESQLPDCVLGVGTIFDTSSAGSYIDLGANYIVGPTFNPEVARTCNRRKVLYIPGCLTPTEISNAEEMGAEVIKLFPASVATPSFVRAILGPMPNTRIMPSGGVRINHKEVKDWIEAGAVAVNIGSDLIREDLVEAGRFDAISHNIGKCILWINEARSSRTN